MASTLLYFGIAPVAAALSLSDWARGMACPQVALSWFMWFWRQASTRPPPGMHAGAQSVVIAAANLHQRYRFAAHFRRYLRLRRRSRGERG
jgi:hypothetical protein